MESLLLWGLVLCGVAILLLFAEAFIPSAGIISIIAAGLGITGLVCLFKHDVTWGVVGTLVMLVLAPVSAVMAFNIMPSTPLGKKMIFGEDGPPDEEMRRRPDAQIAALFALIGTDGTALTDLRPVGTAEFKGQRVQASSEIGLISAGARVRATGVDGVVLKVRPSV